ncbi:integral membrane protein GPR155 [Hylaeus volcanicus]|uniref:integral membrane protein GPR155 n=1 Tax=Hylaeus volcanicus TaxID=313075 RepID=UPI0023B8550A|nr:integral membrane protein GPR155 [Hylaeus volcanicus]XP_053981547.1 integral membrane protein GPR155 [Hylaeus volcanicus]XP_053981548.1 integral membrane protein GPR155 [Hylaeus volcanicus]XP_053981549.1 integral membrane protein GPR155 [Hylaeus volcanicus]
MEPEPMDNLYLALIQCFAIILCGYIAGRFNVISKVEATGLNTFVGTFALPCLIFMSLAKLDFTLVNWKFLLAVLLAKSSIFFLVLGVSLVIKRPSNPGCAALFAIFTTQSNDFAIGYPMIAAIYGKTHPEYSAYLYLMAPISLAILNPIGFVLLEIGKRRTENHTSYKDMVYSIAKGIALNPVLFMTILGIIGNLIFSHVVPCVLATVLDVFGNAFSATALFLLGLMMVGKVHKLKGTALVIPGILISVKLLVLPLVIRESIILLNTGGNATDTQDLSTYGFLYGTIPTAPALFIFTLRYNLEIDLIASAMVACTFLSAPLMFVSAKLIDAVSAGITPANYMHQINLFSFDVSVASITVCVWLLICFLGLERKKYTSATHRCTLCIVIAQLATAVGVVIWTKLEPHSTGSVLWYVQFVLITTGVYASRMWTMAIAATLLYLSSRSLNFVKNMQKWFFPAGWGLPLLIVIIMCSTITPKDSELEFRNPNFQFGRIQAAISTLLLIFCFIVTLGCLVLQQRYQRRHISSSYNNLPDNVENSNNDDTERRVVDVEDLVSPTSHTPTIGCEYPDGCQNGVCRGNYNEIDECDMYLDAEYERNATNDPQTLRHLVFLILLLCSMLIALSITVGTLITEQVTGVYAELAFFDIALNFGQSLIAFAIFGLDPGLGKLGCWLRKMCRKWRTGKELQLPPEDELSIETRAIREQFNRCHLAECRDRIAICRRRLLTVYKGVFTGTDLVNWLLDAGVAQTRDEAVLYGRCLLESRVLQHIDGTRHFCDENLLYTFNA